MKKLLLLTCLSLIAGYSASSQSYCEEKKWQQNNLGTSWNASNESDADNINLCLEHIDRLIKVYENTTGDEKRMAGVELVGIGLYTYNIANVLEEKEVPVEGDYFDYYEWDMELMPANWMEAIEPSLNSIHTLVRGADLTTAISYYCSAGTITYSSSQLNTNRGGFFLAYYDMLRRRQEEYAKAKYLKKVAREYAEKVRAATPAMLENYKSYANGESNIHAYLSSAITIINSIRNDKDIVYTYGKEDEDLYIKVLTSFVHEYAGFSSSFKSEIASRGYTSYQEVLKLIDEIETRPVKLSADQMRQLAGDVAQIGEKSKACDYYVSAYEKGLNTVSFYKEALDVMIPAGHARTNNFLDRWYAVMDKTECYNFSDIQGYAERAGYRDLLDRIKPEQKLCMDQAEIKRKKEEKDRKLRDRGKLHMALSIYPLAFYAKDFGGAVEFYNRKNVYEFGYKRMMDNKEYFVKREGNTNLNPSVGGDYRYNGFRGYFMYKHIIKRGHSGPYAGFMLHYSERVFDTILASVTNLSTSSTFPVIFNPKQTEQNLFFIGGIRALTKSIIIDFYGGFGPGLRNFSDKEGYVGSSRYSIKDDLLKNRKPQSFVFNLTGGIKFGINF